MKALSDSVFKERKVLKEKTMMNVIREHKTMLVIVGVCLFLIELEIFAIAVMKSGRKSMLQVMNTSGAVIYETDGKNLSSFDKYYFEKTFGPFENYHVKMKTREVPFPFRAWFTGAIGLPVGFVLLFSFILKAFAALFYKGKKEDDQENVSVAFDGSETRLERWVMRISRFNIFAIGFLVFCLIFSYWAVPNMITYVGRLGVEALTQYKWFFIGLAGVLLSLIVFIIYLRYLLAKRSIDAQTELEKYRLELEYTRKEPPIHKLEYVPDNNKETQMITWEIEDHDEEQDVPGDIDGNRNHSQKYRL